MVPMMATPSALPISRVALLSPDSVPARAGGMEAMMPVDELGMLRPIPVEMASSASA